MDVVWNGGLLAAVFAAIGLLATALFRLDAKIDSKIDALSARMDSRFDRLEDRLAEHLRTPH